MQPRPSVGEFSQDGQWITRGGFWSVPGAGWEGGGVNEVAVGLGSSCVSSDLGKVAG